MLLGLVASLSIGAQSVTAKVRNSYSLTAQLPVTQTNANVTYFDLTAPENSVQPLTVIVTNHAAQALQVTVSANDAYTANSGLISYDHAAVKTLNSPQALRFSKLVQGRRTQTVSVAAGKATKVTFKVKMPATPFNGLILGGIRSVAVVGAGGAGVQSQVAYNLSVVLRHNATPVMPKVQLKRILPGVQLGKSGIRVQLQNTQAAIVSQMTFSGTVTKRGAGKASAHYQQRQLQMAPHSEFNYFMPTKTLAPGHYKLQVRLTGRNGYAQVLTKQFHVTAGQQLSSTAPALKAQAINWWFYGIMAALGLLSAMILIYWGYRQGRIGGPRHRQKARGGHDNDKS